MEFMQGTANPTYNRKLKQAIQPRFLHYVKPHNVLVLFQVYSSEVLTQGDIDRVNAVTDQRGNHDGAIELLNRLIVYNGWFSCLMQVLRDRNVKLGHVADEMEKSKDLLDKNVDQESQQYEAVIRRLKQELEQKEQGMLDLKTRIEKLEEQEKEHMAALNSQKVTIAGLMEDLKIVKAAKDCLEKEVKELNKALAMKEQQEDMKTDFENLKKDRAKQDALIKELRCQIDHFTRSVLSAPTPVSIMPQFAIFGQQDVLDRLMRRDAENTDINSTSACGKTAVMYAAEHGHLECLRWLLSQQPFLDLKDEHCTALFYAVRGGHNDCVEALIAAGADIDVTDNVGNTPLMEAASRDDIQCLETLIIGGCNVHKRNNYGKTALLWAIKKGNCESLRLILDAYADPNEPDEALITPLMVAAQKGNPECVQALVEAGAHISAEDKDKLTPLMHAVKGGNVEVVRLLIDSGANLCDRDAKRMTPLMWAAWLGKTECVKVLLKVGAELHAQDKNFETPLMHAAQQGHSECVRILASAGAGTQQRNGKGQTAIDLARSPSCKSILENLSDLS